MEPAIGKCSSLAIALWELQLDEVGSCLHPTSAKDCQMKVQMDVLTCGLSGSRIHERLGSHQSLLAWQAKKSVIREIGDRKSKSGNRSGLPKLPGVVGSHDRQEVEFIVHPILLSGVAVTPMG